MMRNKIVGFLIIGISIIIGIIIWAFNRALTEIVSVSCSHGDSCPMWGSIRFHTTVSAVIMALILLIGLYLVFFGREERIVTKVKRVNVKPKPGDVGAKDLSIIMKSLDSDQKKVLQPVLDNDGTIFQSEIVDKTGFTKVKVTRILDKLEGRGIVERRRRGMTNVVILKTRRS
jgi:hypothetical protein